MTSRADLAELGVLLSEKTIKPFYAVELMFDTSPVRLWTGFGERTIDGETFVGTKVGGESLLMIEGIEEVSDMSAKGVSVTFAGANVDLISAALQENYQWRTGAIYFGAEGVPQPGWILASGYWADDGMWMDGAVWRDSVGEVDWYAYKIFSGLIDTMPVKDEGTHGTITVTIESEMIRLQRPNVRRRTSASHKARYPNDTFFDYVEALQNKEIPFGRQATS